MNYRRHSPHIGSGRFYNSRAFRLSLAAFSIASRFPQYWAYRAGRWYLQRKWAEQERIPVKDFRKRFVKSSHKKSVNWVKLVPKSREPKWVKLVK